MRKVDSLAEETVGAVVVVMVRGVACVGVGDVTGLGVAGEVRGNTDRQHMLATANTWFVDQWTTVRRGTYVSPACARLSPTCSVDDFANSGFKAALAAADQLRGHRIAVTIPINENDHVNLMMLMQEKRTSADVTSAHIGVVTHIG
jgi:hypothetical protein